MANVLWDGDAARVLDLRVDVGDADLVRLIPLADKAGIDCPLGWPQAFVEFVVAHQEQRGTYPDPALTGPTWRWSMAWRVTDHVVSKEVHGLRPLSVVAEKIAHPAMRAAAVLSRLPAVDRAGGGVVVEVYPAASMRLWGLPTASYKRPKQRPALSRLVDALQVQAPWLVLGEFESLCRTSDHAFDALVAALTARAAACGATAAPLEQDRRAAEIEGWIALPTCALADLPRLAVRTTQA